MRQNYIYIAGIKSRDLVDHSRDFVDLRHCHNPGYIYQDLTTVLALSDFTLR